MTAEARWMYVKGRHLAGCSFQCCRALTARANSGRRQEQTQAGDESSKGPSSRAVGLCVCICTAREGQQFHRHPSTRLAILLPLLLLLLLLPPSSRSSLQPCCLQPCPPWTPAAALKVAPHVHRRPPCKTGPYTAAGHGLIAPAVPVPVLDVLRAACLRAAYSPTGPCLPFQTSPRRYNTLT